MWRYYNQLTEKRHFRLRYSGLDRTNDSRGRLNLGVLGPSCHRPQMVIKAAMVGCSSHSRSAAARRQLWAVLLWLNIQRWFQTCQTYRYAGHAGSVAHAVIHNMWPSTSSTFMSSEEGRSSLNTFGARSNPVNITWWLLASRTLGWFTFNPDAYANDRHSLENVLATQRSSEAPVALGYICRCIAGLKLACMWLHTGCYWLLCLWSPKSQSPCILGSRMGPQMILLVTLHFVWLLQHLLHLHLNTAEE